MKLRLRDAAKHPRKEGRREQVPQPSPRSATQLEARAGAATDRVWAIIHGLVILLKPFWAVTSVVSGSGSATFIHVLPELRQIKSAFSNDAIVDLNADLSPPILRFVDAYKATERFSDSLILLDFCRGVLLRSLLSIFGSLDTNTLWTPLLDPRYLRLHHLSDEECELARNIFMTEVMTLTANERTPAHHEALHTQVGLDESPEDDLVPRYLMFTSAKPQRAGFDVALVSAEVRNYLDFQSPTTSKTDPLKWWRSHRKKYPNVALAARKWFSVCATSTPSERVFFRSRSCVDREAFRSCCGRDGESNFGTT